MFFKLHRLDLQTYVKLVYNVYKIYIINLNSEPEQIEKQKKSRTVKISKENKKKACSNLGSSEYQSIDPNCKRVRPKLQGGCLPVIMHDVVLAFRNTEP